MDMLSIVPPFTDEDVHTLFKEPVALFVHDHEEHRGMIIGVDLHPSNVIYLVILEVEFGEYESCTLGFTPEKKGWVLLEKDDRDTWFEVIPSHLITIKRAPPIVYAEY